MRKIPLIYSINDNDFDIYLSDEKTKNKINIIIDKIIDLITVFFHSAYVNIYNMPIEIKIICKFIQALIIKKVILKF